MHHTTVSLHAVITGDTWAGFYAEHPIDVHLSPDQIDMIHEQGFKSVLDQVINAVGGDFENPEYDRGYFLVTRVHYKTRSIYLTCQRIVPLDKFECCII